MQSPVHAKAVGERGGWTATAPDVTQAVRRAGRHSIAVRIVRIVLPLGAFLCLAGLVIVTYFNPLKMIENAPAVSGKLAIQGSKITMELPRIAGFTRDARGYELTAESAVQDIASPDIVELQNLRARMELQDQEVNIVAKAGTYNTKGDKVILRDQVLVTTNQGFTAKLREAAVEMKAGKVVSEHPVEITFPDGVLNANKMEVLDSGDVIRFERGVVMDLKSVKQEASR